VAYATATYLAGEYAMAYTVIEKYFENLSGISAEGFDKYGESELVLFQNRCLEKQEKYNEAIEHLEKHASMIVDKLTASVKTAEYLVRTGDFGAAKEKWMALTLSQTENYRFHCGLQAAYLEIAAADCDAVFGLKRLDLPCTHWQLSAAQNATINDMYSSKEQFASSRAVSKIRLSLVNNADELRARLDIHCRKCLSEGVPSLYHDIAFLVRQADLHKPDIVTIVSDTRDFRVHPNAVVAIELVSGYIDQLKSTGHFSAQDHAASSPKESPATLLWAMYLHANLLERCGQLEEANKWIDECVEHTPTALDMHVRKGKILRKCGNIADAAMVVENVRALDLQDRYLNNKATKYLLRADNVPQAMETIAMFTKHDGSDPQQTLTDLQCNWYELELAESYARCSKWGLALKKFYSVQKHFLDYVEDMFDFHSYAQARKVISTVVHNACITCYRSSRLLCACTPMH
jgi:tetratricopeptide (TPR) repeat protein